MYVYISISIAYANPRAWSKCVRWCSQHLTIVHICTCIVLNSTCECMPTLRKHAYGLVHVHLCNGAVAFLSWKLLRTYLESCANIIQAVVYRPPSCGPRQARPSPPARPPAALLPPSCRQSVARRCSLQKPVQIHASSWRGRRRSVAQASSNHPRWCRPHPVCLWVALALGQRMLPVTEMHFFSIFARVFSHVIVTCVCHTYERNICVSHIIRDICVSHM